MTNEQIQRSHTFYEIIAIPQYNGQMFEAIMDELGGFSKEHLAAQYAESALLENIEVEGDIHYNTYDDYREFLSAYLDFLHEHFEHYLEDCSDWEEEPIIEEFDFDQEKAIEIGMKLLELVEQNGRVRTQFMINEETEE